MVDDTGSDSKATTRRVVIAVLVLLVAIGAVAIWLVRRGGDDTSATTTTSVATTDTSAHPTEPGSSTSTSSATAPADDATATAVWPRSDTARRFEDPVAAARSFAVDFAGFTDPVLGEFRQGDSRSGEVEVRPQADGPVTTVFVRQLGDDGSWWVLGSATANIEVTEPAALATIGDPVTLKGTANAFEGTVDVDIRADGRDEPLAKGFVTGRMGEMGPFDSTLSFPSPHGGYGAVVFRTLSAEDGSVWEAAVVRVKFADG